jgi:hypothetical protein
MKRPAAYKAGALVHGLPAEAEDQLVPAKSSIGQQSFHASTVGATAVSMHVVVQAWRGRPGHRLRHGAQQGLGRVARAPEAER